MKPLDLKSIKREQSSLDIGSKSIFFNTERNELKQDFNDFKKTKKPDQVKLP